MARLSFLRAYLLIGLLLTGLLIFHYIGWLRPIENFLRALFMPTVASLHSFSVETSGRYQFFTNTQEFLASYSEAVAKVEQLEIVRSENRLLIEKNQELKKLLNFQERSKTRLVTADVIGNSFDGTEKSVIINAGRSSGIIPHQPVIVGEGILVGKVLRAEENSAVVRLTNDNRSQIGAMVLNKERSQGVVEGGYGISLKMKFIPRNETVLVGEKVVTSGLDSGIPRGLFIGTIAAIENEPYKPFQQTLLTPATNLSKLLLVSVILTDVDP